MRQARRGINFVRRERRTARAPSTSKNFVVLEVGPLYVNAGAVGQRPQVYVDVLEPLLFGDAARAGQLRDERGLKRRIDVRLELHGCDFGNDGLQLGFGWDVHILFLRPARHDDTVVLYTPCLAKRVDFVKFDARHHALI